MAETPSNMLPLGTKAKNFSLIDVCTKKFVSLNEAKSDLATVIMFICNHCPYVKHIQQKLTDVAKKYQKLGIVFIAINSNDSKNYPADSPEKMRIEVESNGYTFPYLFDETQEVARAYQAACTPDFYIFDNDLKCIYRGRFDDSRPGNDRLVTGKDLADALDNIIAGRPVNHDQQPSVGCNIKWKK